MTNELKELVARWRAEAKSVAAGFMNEYGAGERSAFDSCADELEAALAAQAEQVEAWRQRVGERWTYFDGPQDPREVHDNGKACEPLYLHPPTALHGSDVVKRLAEWLYVHDGQPCTYGDQDDIYLPLARAALDAALAAGKGESNDGSK